MTPSRRLAALALVFVGGALGGSVRLAIGLGLDGPVAWHLVLINVIGAGLLGWVVGRMAHTANSLVYAAVGPGFLGGFTTFSGLAAFAWATGTDAAGAAGGAGQSPSLHIAVLLATTASAVVAAAAGWAIGARARDSAGAGPGAAADGTAANGTAAQGTT